MAVTITRASQLSTKVLAVYRFFKKYNEDWYCKSEVMREVQIGYKVIKPVLDLLVNLEIIECEYGRVERKPQVISYKYINKNRVVVKDGKVL